MRVEVQAPPPETLDRPRERDDAGLGVVDGCDTLGLERGEVVSILSEDNKEWIYADLGVQCVGGIVSGVYPTDSA